MINLSLTLDEINTILIALSEGPYQKVAGVISKVEAQAKAQLEESTNESNVEVEIVE